MTADTQQRVIGLPVIKESANHGPLTSAAEGVAFHDRDSNNGSTQNLIPPAAVCRRSPPLRLGGAVGTLCSRVCSTGAPEERYGVGTAPPWSPQPHPPCFLKKGPRKNFVVRKFPGYRTSAKGKPPHRFCSVRRFSFTLYSGIRTSTFGLWKITQAAP